MINSHKFRSCKMRATLTLWLKWCPFSLKTRKSFLTIWQLLCFKFVEVVSATEDTEDKIASLLALHAIGRSFKFKHSNFQEGSSTTASMATGSKATRSNARFALSDLEDDMYSDLLMVKQEKASSLLPPKRTQIDLTVKTPGSRKRKTFEAAYLSLENLGVEEALKKLVSAHISQSTVDLRIRVKMVERALKEKEKE